MTKLAQLKKTMLADAAVKQAYDDMADEFQLASAVIAARANAGLTQEQLATLMHAKQSLVARIEAGGHNTTVRTLQRIAAATGTHLRISFDP